MNKNEFLAQLRKKLNRLPEQEIETAIRYYEEYFSDAGVENEQKVIQELGSPSAVASKIIGEYIVSDKSKSRWMKWIWIVILAIFASPIALPFAFAFVMVLLSVIISVLAVFFSIGICGVGLAVGGLAAVFISVPLFFSDFATAVFFLGSGMLVASSGTAIVIGFWEILKVTVLGIKRMTGRALIRRSQR